MTEALIDYGLFLAKTLTILISIGLLLAGIIRARRTGHLDGDHLEVTSLNDRYRELAHPLRRASSPKKTFLKSLKADRKAE